MAAKTKRAWYIDKLGSIGIVEEGTNAITKDGYTSNWQSISQIIDLRIYAISQDIDLSVNDLTGTWSQIPLQFHEVLVNKVIANGYKDPRRLELQAAQYFDGEYDKGIREAKKFSRSNYQTTGTIVPHDF
tara:strand:+ start:670 stop:1059 length:390 start_codon:yes stop_codon:yes gene_type:complete